MNLQSVNRLITIYKWLQLLDWLFHATWNECLRNFDHTVYMTNTNIINLLYNFLHRTMSTLQLACCWLSIWKDGVRYAIIGGTLPKSTTNAITTRTLFWRQCLTGKREHQFLLFIELDQINFLYWESVFQIRNSSVIS